MAYFSSLVQKLVERRFVKAEILKSETLKWRGRMRTRFSIQPVLKPQAGDLGEVHGVAGEERGVVGDGDAGDFQVHGADSDSALLELVKQCCRFLIEGEDQPVGEQIDLLLQSRIDRDLPVRVIGAVEQCQPTAKMLFDGDNGGAQRVGLILEARAQDSSGSRVFLEFGEVIGIKHFHDLQARVGFRDTPGPSAGLP